MKWKQSSLFLVAIIVLSSFAVHKFYVGMFQMKFVPQKKELHITTRIFVDDLNLALEKKFHKKKNSYKNKFKIIQQKFTDNP